MKINLKLDTSKNKKEGFPLVLSIYVSKTDRLYRFSGFFSTLENWDFKKEEPKKSHPLYIGIMSYILETKQKINDLLNQRQKMSAQQIFEYLNGKDDDFYSFWEERIEEITNTGTRNIQQSTLNVFRDYRKSLTFSEIDYNFLNGFKLFKKGTCSNNGINSYLKNIRAIYNEGIKRGRYIPNTYISPFNKIMEKPEPTKDKYLTIEEIKLIKNKQDKTKYDKYFLLMFLLGGIDFIDLANLKKEHIAGNRVKFTRFKGGTNEVINNFIFPEAEVLIKELQEGDYITDIFKSQNINTVRGNFTKRYRKQLEEIGVTSYFSSKSARYTFINIGKELLLNRDVLMELTGHARGDVHSIYEGKFPNHIKDEVHRKIIDAVFSDD